MVPGRLPGALLAHRQRPAGDRHPPRQRVEKRVRHRPAADVRRYREPGLGPAGKPGGGGAALPAAGLAGQPAAENGCRGCGTAGRGQTGLPAGEGHDRRAGRPAQPDQPPPAKPERADRPARRRPHQLDRRRFPRHPHAAGADRRLCRAACRRRYPGRPPAREGKPHPQPEPAHQNAGGGPEPDQQAAVQRPAAAPRALPRRGAAAGLCGRFLQQWYGRSMPGGTGPGRERRRRGIGL